MSWPISNLGKYVSPLWTPKEINLMKNEYPKIGGRISNLIPTHSPNSIKTMASKLGIKFQGERLWLQTESRRRATSKQFKLLWKDPRYRKKRIEHLRSLHTDEWKNSMSNLMKAKWSNPEYHDLYVRLHSEGQKRHDKIHREAITKAAAELKKSGHRVIILDYTSFMPIPDVIAVKDNRISAIEVEVKVKNSDMIQRNSRYRKVGFYDEVIWIDCEKKERVAVEV